MAEKEEIPLVKKIRERDNVIFIGKQPAIVYATSVMMQAQDGQETIILKARGMSMKTAIDVSQLALRRFVPNYEIGEIKVGTEEKEFIPREGQPKEEGRKVMVSTIEISLIKTKTK